MDQQQIQQTLQQVHKQYEQTQLEQQHKTEQQDQQIKKQTQQMEQQQQIQQKLQEQIRQQQEQIGQQQKQTEQQKQVQEDRTRLPTMVAYVYSEGGESWQKTMRKENLEFFLIHGLCEKCSNLDIFIVINGPVSFTNFPSHQNLQIHRRNDTCGSGDFGAWDYLLSIIDYKKYKRLMFINDTVRGPYVDPIVRRLRGPDFHFTDIFSELISKNTKLVGSSISCGGWGGKGPAFGISHVQTFDWMTDDVGIEIIRPDVKCFKNKEDAVVQGEIGLSRKIINANYNIGSTMLAYRGLDFRASDDAKYNCNNGDDPTIFGIHGQQLHPMEIVFFKNSRNKGIHPIIDEYTKILNNMGPNPI